MRLVRFGDFGSEKPGVIDAEGRLRDLSSVVDDIGGEALGEQIARIRATDVSRLPVVADGVRLGACVGKVPNVVCIGLNYREHAAETHAEIPKEPLLFNKHTSAISGPDDPVIVPPDSKKLDWEVELGVVIGHRCWHVDDEAALDYVAGYCLATDVSERAYQKEMGGQWVKGKSYFSFGPIGPWLVTADEIADPQKLDLWLDVNGIRRQSGTTSTMIFGVRSLVAYLSRFMALAAGDVIMTGTPSGVGGARTPPIFLKSGDVFRLGGAGLGEQNHRVLDYGQYSQR